MADQKSDVQLVADAKAGNDVAFHELVKRHGTSLLTLCRSILGNISDAEDSAQEALLRACLKLRSLRSGELFGAWLRQIAYRACLDRLKRSDPELFAHDAELILPANEAGPHQQLERAELNQRVRDAVRQLPARYRVPIILRDLEGLPYKEVAAFLNIPVGTAKSHVSIGRKLLRELLRPLGNEDQKMADNTEDDGTDLYPNFTDRARLAIELAKAEANRRAGEVGIVDLAVGLVQLPDREASLLREHGMEGIGGLAGGLAGLLMRQQGITAEALRDGRPANDGENLLASVLQHASKAAAEFQLVYVGTEHLLLAIISQPVGSEVLRRGGVTADLVRNEIVRRG